jgi:hypothetical protein
MHISALPKMLVSFPSPGKGAEVRESKRAAKPDHPSGPPSAAKKPFIERPNLGTARLAKPGLTSRLGPTDGHRPPGLALGHAHAPGQQTQQSQEMTLQGLIKAWGQSDSPYDLNGDKTVDVQDLIKFMMSWPHGQTTDPAPAEKPSISTQPVPEAEPSISPNQPSPADLPAAPETDPPQGPVIDGQRPTDMLTSPDSPQPTSPADPSIGPAAAPPQDSLEGPPPAEPAQLSLEGLIQAWGQSDSSYDLNGDQTVDVLDLTQFILQWPHHEPEEAAQGDPAIQGQPGAPADTAALDELASLFIDKLVNRGLDQQPPANLSQLLQSLPLDESGRAHVLKVVMTKLYPDGLGVDVVG